MEKKVTLLDNLCFVAGYQGGTIHQFCNITTENFDVFQKQWEELYELNGMMLSVDDFIKIAARANYEGLIWRAKKISVESFQLMSPEARDSYITSRGNWNVL